MTRKLSNYATTLHHDGDFHSVTYHYTDIVKWDNDRITLNANGYFTATTKRRMNEVSEIYDLGYHIDSKQGTWIISYNGSTIPFTADSMTLDRKIE